MRLSEGVYPLLIPLPNPAILASIVESFDRRLQTNPRRIAGRNIAISKCA
jgi:hypothetical protein